MKVTVKTPARLHLGLIDLNGDLGRMFGGLGVGIDHPNVLIEAQNSNEYIVTGSEVELTKTLVNKFCLNYHVQPRIHIHIAATIPSHVGLGSGTQLALAVAVALSKLLGVKASVPDMAVAMGRTKRTSIGTNIFMQGGFVVDGGKNLKTNAVPPLIYRQSFPKDWRFVIAIPNQTKGLSSAEENKAFSKLSAMPSCDVAKICRFTMFKLLPALAENDIQSFGEALTEIQLLTGKYFAEAQGGTYSSLAIADCVEFMKQTGAYGVGQSSWGPTVYAVVKKEQAKQLLTDVKAYLRREVGGQAFIAKANNTGAFIKTLEV